MSDNDDWTPQTGTSFRNAKKTKPVDADRTMSTSRFRFKRKSSGRRRDDINEMTNISKEFPLEGRVPHRRRHRRDRKHYAVESHKHTGSPRTEPYISSARDPLDADPEAAFRESLFDAMGDDEGAAYWESVYGQPIHTYPAEKMNQETGELEKMSEEEYIAFVRKGMWERSHEGLKVEKERLRRERESKKAREKKSDDRKWNQSSRSSRNMESNHRSRQEATVFDSKIEESLRRGRERKESKKWLAKWNRYNESWDRLQQLAGSGSFSSDRNQSFRAEEIFWPVESGGIDHITPFEIENFMVNTAESLARLGNGITDSEQPRSPLLALLSNLKIERVRWHPDKVQHRFGATSANKELLKKATEVFQIMDQLYNQRRHKGQ